MKKSPPPYEKIQAKANGATYELDFVIFDILGEVNLNMELKRNILCLICSIVFKHKTGLFPVLYILRYIY